MNIHKNYVRKKKPPLDIGWLVLPSRSYPDRVYYFNTITGCSSWDEPMFQLQKEQSIQDSKVSGQEKAEKISSKSVLKAKEGSTTAHVSPCSQRKSNKFEVSSTTSDLSLPSVCVDKSKTAERKNGTSAVVLKWNHLNNERNKYMLSKKGNSSGKIISESVSVKKRMWRHRRFDAMDSNKQRTGEETIKKVKLNRSSWSDNLVESPNEFKRKPCIVSSSRGCTNKLSKDRLFLKARRNKGLSGNYCAETDLRSSQESTASDAPVSRGMCQMTSLPKSPERNSLNKNIKQNDCHGSAAKRLAVFRKQLAEKRKLIEDQNNNSVHEGCMLAAIKQPRLSAEKSNQFVDDTAATLKVATAARIEYSKPFTSAKQLKMCNKRAALEQTTIQISDLKSVPKQAHHIAPAKATVPKTSDHHMNSAATRLEKLKGKLSTNSNKCKQLDSSQDSSSLVGPDVLVSVGINRIPSLVSADASSLTTVSNNMLFEEAMELDPQEEDFAIEEDSAMVLDIRKMRTELREKGGVHYEERLICADMAEMETTTIAPTDGRHEWYIVIDTNIFLSSLGYVQDLRDTKFKNLGFPVLVIPWYVVQELDRLKDHSSKPRIAVKARRAVQYLRANFKTNHPRIRGQTILEANPQTKYNADDGILRCCMQLAKIGKTVLLSNDQSLCNKANVNGVEAFLLEEMQASHIYEGTIDGNNIFNGPESNTDKLNSSISSSSVTLTTEDVEAPKADNIMCNLKACLKGLLNYVLQNEMQKAYGDMWLKIVLMKPPWSLEDIFACLIKHWIAVFGTILQNKAKHYIESLQRFFTNNTKTKGYGYSLADMQELIKISLNFCLMLPSDDYGNLVTECHQNLEKLLLSCSTTHIEWNANKALDIKQVSTDREKGISNVLHCFNIIWTAVSTFCGGMCQVMSIKHTMECIKPLAAPSLTDIQNQMPEIFPLVRDLLNHIESILDIPVGYLTPKHPTVHELYSTLSSYLSSVDDDPEEKIIPEYIVHFCSCPKSRQMLVTGRKQFQEFQRLVNEGIYYLVNK